MKAVLGMVLAVVVLAAYSGLVRGADADAKEVTLKGTLLCAKCKLHETDKCQTALRVKEGDTKTVYYLTENDVSKPEHGKICSKPMHDVTVTGTVEEKDGKKWLTATKIEMPEEKKSE
jgi:hypothetical protein